MTLRTYDNTRLSDFKRCPRYYFYRHVMHWVPNGTSLPLIFGSAWHQAMDVMWLGITEGIKENELVMMAYDAFLKCWKEMGMPDPSEIDLVTQKELLPRTPSRALDMLYEYYARRQRVIRELELISVERSFVVPMKPDDPELFYVGKIDKTARVSGRIRAFDHKTTTAMKLDGDSYKVRPMYLETFSPDSQMDGYVFNLRMTYPDDKVDCWVDVALVHSKDEDFKFVSIDRTDGQLNSWLGQTLYWIDLVEKQALELQECSEYDDYMTAYPMNTNSCFDFNTHCPFINLCKSRPNPLTWGDQAPPGYQHSVWNPLEHAGNPELK